MERGVFSQIDWFRERGFLLGRDKSRDIYYIVDSGTGRRYDFNSLNEAQKFVEGVETERINSTR